MIIILAESHRVRILVEPKFDFKKTTISTFGNESKNIFFQNFIAKKVKKSSKKKEQKEKIRVNAR